MLLVWSFSKVKRKPSGVNSVEQARYQATQRKFVPRELQQ